MQVCVLGAGLQGVLCALELAERGHDVILYEAQDSAIRAASLNNEGKVHLGYVYAKDTSGKTAGLMAEGALQFGALLDRWWPEADMAATASDRFDYLVLRESLETADWLGERYRQIDAMISDKLAGRGRRYLGAKAVQPVHRLTDRELEERYDGTYVAAAFHTEERAIDLPRMATRLREALAAYPNTHCRWNTKVDAVIENSNGTFSIKAEGLAPDGPFSTVINALWSDRLRVDATLGIKVQRPFTFRHKVANHIQLPQSVSAGRSVTMVIGPFGDFVSLPSGLCYVSWYPSGCLRKTTAIAPPREWAHTSEEWLSDVFEESAAQLARRIKGFDQLVSRATERSSVPGVIFCWGDTDIDDPESEFHLRHDVGINTYRPGYYSIDTGKLTLAPMFAATLADRIGSK